MSVYPQPPAPQNNDEKMWGMLCHLSAIAGYVIAGIGFILGPLIIWLVKKDEYPFVNDQGKEALNFQISMLIYSIISVPLCLIGIGFLLLAAIGITQLVLIIMASIAANNGTAYRYPLTIRLVK